MTRRISADEARRLTECGPQGPYFVFDDDGDYFLLDHISREIGTSYDRPTAALFAAAPALAAEVIALDEERDKARAEIERLRAALDDSRMVAEGLVADIEALRS